MNFEIFSKEHVNQAIKIAMANYRKEREQVPMLPSEEQLPLKNMLPEMEHFVKVGLGVAAMEKHQLLGFLCGYWPREDAFGSTGIKGTFSPIHGHGIATHITGEARDRLYSLLYQEAAKRWVGAGIRSHAIALYTNDRASLNSFFYNGFGLRCIDLIRSLEVELEPVELSSLCGVIEFKELPREEWKQILPLHNKLIKHLDGSPTFMHFSPMTQEDLYAHASEDIRYFAVDKDGEYIAFIKLADGGENFVTEHAGMVNICGAYCDPRYRGMGVYHNLLAYLIKLLNQEGYQLLGVDCESINPTARAFWTKYFTEYTHSVVRRIDEKAVDIVIKETVNKERL